MAELPPWAEEWADEHERIWGPYKAIGTEPSMTDDAREMSRIPGWLEERRRLAEERLARRLNGGNA